MRTLVREALSALGIERLVLGVHESCFPCDADEDLGRGSPYGALGRDLLRFAFELGFDTVQLGPQGECAAEDPSPYDGAAFARSTAALSLARLSEEGLLSDETRARLLEGVRGATSEHARAVSAMREVLDEAHRRAESTGSAIERRLGFIATHADWLLSDATYEALLAEHGEIDFVEWDDAHDRSGYAWPSDASLARRSAIESRHRAVMDRWVLAQALAHEQHDELRAFAHGLGLSLFGDLQIGWSRRDLWANQRLFLRELRLGAPPSRTNPEGQPWGYPVLDPAQPAAVGRLVEARLHKLAREYDGLRVDHPHGWVCPWVYSPVGEPHAAVRAGGRLHESPERPELARFAVVRRDQLDFERAPWDDARVTALSPAQIDDYAVWIDRMRVIFGERLACEVLSTMPRPLGEVVRRHGLPRFRVTQKVDLHDPRDVYRSENARPEDWIMVGTHDTDPIWSVTGRWVDEGRGEGHARYLAERLGRGSELVEAIANDPWALARAKLAELFTSAAKNVYVWWGDLFGELEPYNRPGVIDPRNWTMRLPRDFRALHARRAAVGMALDLRLALGAALSARGHRELARALDPNGV